MSRPHEATPAPDHESDTRPPRGAGAQLRLRQLGAGDEAVLRAVHEGLSSTSRFLRYHTPMPTLRPSMVRHLLDLHPGRHQAVVAVLRDRPVGIGRWIRDRMTPTVAEVAVEVVDAAHGRGIGAVIVADLARTACRAGIETFAAYVLPDNVRASGWAAALDPVTDETDPDCRYVPVHRLLRDETPDRSAA